MNMFFRCHLPTMDQVHKPSRAIFDSDLSFDSNQYSTLKPHGAHNISSGHRIEPDGQYATRKMEPSATAALVLYRMSSFSNWSHTVLLVPSCIPANPMFYTRERCQSTQDISIHTSVSRDVFVLRYLSLTTYSALYREHLMPAVPRNPTLHAEACRLLSLNQRINPGLRDREVPSERT